MFKNILLSKMIINHYFLFKIVIFLNKDKFLIFMQLYTQILKSKIRIYFNLYFVYFGVMYTFP
jgi:hypothetical protein